jgi:hypothetical protein
VWIGGRQSLKKEGFWVGIVGKKREEQDRSLVRERVVRERESVLHKKSSLVNLKKKEQKPNDTYCKKTHNQSQN